MSRTRALLVGCAAGAAGTAALDVSTYVDMAVRGRAASSTPADTVEKLAELAHVPIPGDDETRDNRVAGLAPLLGAVAGIGVGAALGFAVSTGWRPPPPLLALAAGAGAMLAGNGPMALLRITNPATWSAADWLSDVVPHAAYGAVTAFVLNAARGGM